MTDKSHTYKTRFTDWIDDELRRKRDLDRGYPYRRQYELARTVGVRPRAVCWLMTRRSGWRRWSWDW